MPSWRRLVKRRRLLAVQSTVSEIRHKRSRYQIVKDQISLPSKRLLLSEDA